MNIKVSYYLKELDDTFEILNHQCDEEVKSVISNALCIRLSGLLEVALKSRISDYSERKSPKEINRFLTQKFKDITNLKSSKLCDVVGQFSASWKEKFEDAFDNNSQMKSSLDSLITVRNNYAHGQSTNITEKSLKQYYIDVKSAIALFDKIIR